jgi:protein-L-isoaspartate(D-aspartate) O-methyltransferase
MPVCPECGIDVAEEGLCPECRKERDTKRPARKRNRGLLYIPILILGAALVFSAAFLIGRSFAASSEGASTGEEAAVSEADVQKDGQAQEEPAKQSVPELRSEFDIRSLPDGPPYDSFEGYMAWMRENTDQQDKYLAEKWERYKWVISWSSLPSLTHDRVIKGFLKTPREYFCREWNLSKAYAHAYLSIGYGQTISGPEIVSRMTNALNPQVEHKVLEIGTGSGYQSAFLAELSNFVYTIEIVEELATETDQIYTDLQAAYPQYGNIKRKRDDGYYGWEEHAPFDRIIVTCGIDHIPPPLLKQLAPDGVMVIPVGPPSGQTILKVTKKLDQQGNVFLEREDIYAGTGTKGDVFVPFTSKDGGVHSKARDGQ